MANYKTPGVYIEEISTLPPSVGQVPTAIPAFIGFTEKAQKNGKNVGNHPIHITSLLEFKQIFGVGPDPGNIKVTMEEGNQSVKSVDFQYQYYLYDSIRMFYANGGGECYVISVGLFGEDIEMEKLQGGLDELYANDHPTMVLMPDAMLLEKKGDCYTLQQAMLKQCNDMQDRFAILDVFRGDTSRKEHDIILDFRSGIGINFLNYGAAYYPWIQTSYSPDFGFNKIQIQNAKGEQKKLEDLLDNPAPVKNLRQIIQDVETVTIALKDPFGNGNTVNTQYVNIKDEDRGTLNELKHYAATVKPLIQRVFDIRDGKVGPGSAPTTPPAAGKGAKDPKAKDAKTPDKGGAKTAPAGGAGPRTIVNENMIIELRSKTSLGSPLSNITRALLGLDLALKLQVIDPAKDFTEFGLSDVKPAPGFAELSPEQQVQQGRGKFKSVLDSVVSVLNSINNDVKKIRDNMDKALYDNIPLYKTIVNEIQIEGGKLPPSGAIAGVYAQIDNNTGVWKAPANVSLAATNRPWVKLDDKEQEDLNIDVNAGKSINAIRAFAGKGTLVWGARTLAGNDNEWRYIPVRRTFIMVEQSVKLSTHWAVFEPNTSITWVKVKAMISNYLTNLWKQGALAGNSPEEAFFVNVGLGVTMTPVDVLEGRMNVEIGMAVVRPAEFIILKFSHKMQES